MRPIAVVSDYRGLVSALRARADELDVSNETLDATTGLAHGYCGKLLGLHLRKPLGRVSLGVLLTPLGVKLVVVEDPEALARVRGRLTRRKHNGKRRQAVDGGRAAAP
jgi:hypothetical protein